MRIGIGITTKDRPNMLLALLASIRKYTDMDNVTVYIADDTKNSVGIAKKKNECLIALKDNDIVFLMDDDIEIIKDGWIEFFTRQPAHWLFLNDKIHNKLASEKYKECGGVFMMLTKNMIDKVGAFNEAFSPYGFEHCEYSQRIYKLGLMPHPYMCKDGTEKYLYAHDYSNPSHKSSITDEEKKQHVQNNWDKFFKEPIKQIYIPL